MKEIFICKNKIKWKIENLKNSKKSKNPKNLQVQMQWSFSLINLCVHLSLQSWRWCLRCCSVVVSSEGMHKVEQNYIHTHTKKKPTKCPMFKWNTVSVSFSACRYNSVVLSSKVGRKRGKKKRVWRQFWKWYLRLAVACLPAAVSLLLLEALFMQISGVSLALTWPCRLCLPRVLLCLSLYYKLSPFQAHWGRWLCVYLQFMWEVGLPCLLCSFPPTGTFTSFPPPDYWAVLLLLPFVMFVYSSRGKWVFPPLLWSFPPPGTLTSFPISGCWAHTPTPSRASPAHPTCLFTVLEWIPFPQSSVLSVPHPLSRVSLLFSLLISKFLFLPRVEVSLSRGLCCFGPGLPVGVPWYCEAHLVHIFPSCLDAGDWQPRGPPCFSV
jgi:hypothetical protein